MKVILAAKRSRLERFEEASDPLVAQLLKSGDASVASLQAAHDSHRAALDRTSEFLNKAGVRVERVALQSLSELSGDLVVTLGGDGTLLWTSHHVPAKLPVVAINSDPARSVGYFCAGDASEVEATLTQALEGKLRKTSLTRMQVEVDGHAIHSRVLNDILFSHACPAATTRFLIRYGDTEESHVSSGIWVGPAAGSTAAQRSAGGRVLPIGSRKLQWVVRELYRPRGSELELVKGMVRPEESLWMKSKVREAKLYFDGAQHVADVELGSVVELRESPQPLTILGLRSRGR